MGAKKLALPQDPKHCYHPTFRSGEQGCSSLCKEALLLMQSSGAIAGRALIMLVCVVGMPALALSGASWSDILKKLQDFHWPAVLQPAASSASASFGEAPQLASPTPTDTPHPACQTSPAASPWQTAATAQSSVVPASYQWPKHPDDATPQEVHAIDENSIGANPSSAVDSFRVVQDRLRELGATYYLLESWGDQRQMYRFYCKMAIGGSADFTRCFEAANGDPLQAMVCVLRQVETWRRGTATDGQPSQN